MKGLQLWDEIWTGTSQRPNFDCHILKVLMNASSVIALSQQLSWQSIKTIHYPVQSREDSITLQCRMLEFRHKNPIWKRWAILKSALAEISQERWGINHSRIHNTTCPVDTRHLNPADMRERESKQTRGVFRNLIMNKLNIYRIWKLITIMHYIHFQVNLFDKDSTQTPKKA